MSVPVFLLGCLGGGIGACLRYLGDGLVMRRATPGFPSGIFLVNALGSFLLGLVVGSFEAGLVDGTWLFVLGGGVLGGFTTFSTAMVDTVRLMHQEAWGRAAANAVGMLVVGVVLALLGLTLGRGL